MPNRRKCRVMGLEDNGDLVAITDYTTLEKAQEILSILEPHSAFVRLTIECDEDADAK